MSDKNKESSLDSDFKDALERLSKGASKNRDKDTSGELSENVYRGLLDRYALLKNVLSLSDQHAHINRGEIRKCSGGQNGCNEPSLKTKDYKLAVTDLFVEKALAHLENRAEEYKKRSLIIHVIAYIVVALGAGLAVFSMLQTPAQEHIETWMSLINGFIKGFTAYGLIVLTSVALWRYGKAMQDQAERLLERRHALRQGRLYIHLRDGSVTLEEMEKAFNWNVSQSNAFSSIPTEAQAPWGALGKEIAGVIPSLVKAGVKASSDKINKHKDKE